MFAINCCYKHIKKHIKHIKFKNHLLIFGLHANRIQTNTIGAHLSLFSHALAALVVLLLSHQRLRLYGDLPFDEASLAVAPQQRMIVVIVAEVAHTAPERIWAIGSRALRRLMATGASLSHRLRCLFVSYC